MTEIVVNGHNFAFVRKALKWATRDVRMLMMDDEELEIAFKAAVTQMGTSPGVVEAAAKTLVIGKAKMAPMARHKANCAKKEVSKAAHQFIVIPVPFTSYVLDGSQSSDDKWRARKPNDSSRWKSRNVSFSLLRQHKRTWLRTRFF